METPDNYSPGVMVSEDQRCAPSLWDTVGSEVRASTVHPKGAGVRVLESVMPLLTRCTRSTTGYDRCVTHTPMCSSSSSVSLTEAPSRRLPARCASTSPETGQSLNLAITAHARARTQWVIEIRPYLTSETRVILVGTKLDLLRDLAHQPLGDPPGHTSCEDIITFSQVH